MPKAKVRLARRKKPGRYFKDLHHQKKKAKATEENDSFNCDVSHERVGNEDLHELVTESNSSDLDESRVDNEELPELVIENNNSDLDLLDGRRIIDVKHFMKEIRSVEQHQFYCKKQGKFVLIKEKRNGLASSFLYQCSSCPETRTVSSERVQSAGSFTVNEAAVWACTSIGSGHHQLEELMSLLDIPIFCFKTFSNLEEKIGTIWEELLLKSMKETGEEEKRLAIEAGEMDPDGIPRVGVVCDCGWLHRSYGHRYTSSGGVACIIGQRTGKLLFMGIRNKYCVLCSSPNPKEHKCFKNWDNSSPAMEADIIVEGFRLSEEMHGVRYKQFIGDGDSSVHKNIIEGVQYGRDVQKIECANHMVKNYTKALYKTASAKSEYGKAINKQRIKRMTAAARGAINYNQEQNLSTKELIEDLKNGPDHVFGKHTKCKPYYCNVAKDAKQSEAKEIVLPVILKAKIMSALNPLIANAKSLLKNKTSNQAESFMHVVTKFTGAKQICRSKRGSYHSRCYGAGINFQLGPGWHTKAIIQSTKFSPSKRLKTFAARRERALLKQKIWKSKKENKLKRRKLAFATVNKSRDPDYGPHSMKPDLPTERLETCKKEFLEALEVTKEKIENIEKETRGTENEERWKFERKNRLTSSKFGEVCKMREDTSCKARVKNYLYTKEFATKATQYGKEKESIARKEYEEKEGVTVQQCGLFVDPERGYLGTTPDGLVGEVGIIEIKCPQSAEEKTPLDAAKNITGFCSEITPDGKLQLKRNHDYYFQIQGQLNITKRAHCDFIIWTPLGMSVERISKDEHFWSSKMLPKLSRFYKECMLPEIIDPRITRSMEIREPEYILDAKKQKQTNVERGKKRKKKHEDE